MELTVLDYESNLDKRLLELFYKSIFYNKKEFDYVRVNQDWIHRYDVSKEYVTRVALDRNVVVGSLGALIRKAKFNEKRIKVGCFVDNCTHPDYLQHKAEIFDLLLDSTEEYLRRNNVKLICGWEFEENFRKDKPLWDKTGFIKIANFNWISSYINLESEYPYPYNLSINLVWRLFFKSMRLHHRVRELFSKKTPERISIDHINEDDVVTVGQFISKNEGGTLSSEYTEDEYKEIWKNNDMHGIVARDHDKIVGVLTYITSSWSGWMFGKPGYDKTFQTFFGFTPDEFVVLPEFRDTSVPMNMILKLLRTKNPRSGDMHRGDYTFVADVFDKNIQWRRNALFSMGFTEPKFDRGVILVKVFDGDIDLSKSNPLVLPARYIITPVLF